MTYRLTLAQIMALVAVVAVAFATAPASIASAFSLVLLVVVGLAVYFRVPWSRMAGWVFACYPLLLLLSLLTTWAAAWYSLGHPPRPSQDDPKHIGSLVSAPHLATWILLFGFLPALAVNLVIVAIDFVRMLHDEHDDLKRFMARTVLPLITWPAMFLYLKTDPGKILYWFFD